ncbi:YcxB family protein [Enterococcus faecalis]|uniref:YcxB family protein n=1 Tax=Enterococcus faecalis TaxID=1351 RepID=UPI001141149F|nr:YcxB family protein [Enterococcus faecalis]NSV80117.1 YcxB family protein [Enterococcus faecalis]TQA92233.1 YcxB family protein [Enterococcus faecalis]
MIFDYNLKKEEYFQSIRLYTRNYDREGKRKIIVNYLSGTFLLLVSLYMILSLYIQLNNFKKTLPDYMVRILINQLFTKHFAYLAMIVLCFVLGIVIIYNGYIYPSRRKIENSIDLNIFEPRQVEINDKGIFSWSLNNETEKNSYFWKDIEDVFETNEFYLMKISKKKIFVLPKRMISKKVQTYYVGKRVTK